MLGRHSTDRHDPAPGAPVGAYLTDEHTLLRILESDHSGAIGEDCLTDRLLELTPQQLIMDWRQVTPTEHKETL